MNAVTANLPLLVAVLAAALLLASVVLATVAHAVAEWDPARAGTLRRIAAILSAIGHGIEGFAFKMPGTLPADLKLADAAKVTP